VVHPRRLGHMIDVWRIVAVLFEANTGEPAFDDPAADALDDLDGATSSEVGD
jgi:hypothetical protein